MGVLSRALERAGLVTVGITPVREHTEKVKPPRALWGPYPYGRPLSAPDYPQLQHGIIRAALDLYAAPDAPVLVEFPEQGSHGDQTLPQATDAQPSASAGADVAFEVTTLRRYSEQWLAEHEGRTGVGISGVDQRRFRGAIRFLESFARGEQADMAQQPHASSQELYTWFWSETALASLLRVVRDRLKASGDPGLDQIAFGIAR